MSNKSKRSLLTEIEDLIDLLEEPICEMSDFKCDENASVTTESIEAYRKDFESNSQNELLMNVLTQQPLQTILRTRKSILTNQHTYSVQIPTEGKPVTAQKSTGRCWLFAALNVMRVPFMKELKLDSFEFSQSYLFFWDKFERCNWFLEQIIDTVNEDLSGRLVQFLLSKPQEDGGQYDMIVNIVEKYGLVPKDVFPEVYSTTTSLYLRRLLNKKLRDYAFILRKAASEMGNKIDLSKLRQIKNTQMNEIYRLLALLFGIPPKTFSWSYRNKDKEFARISDITPLEFYNKYVRKHVNVANMISLVNDPRNEYNKLYTVDRLMNIANGARKQVLYVNLPIEKLKEFTIASLKDGEPVWFGCHVSQHYWGEDGIMDTTQFDYKSFLNVSFDLNKGERLDYGESLMTHAMVFTGVDLDEKNNNKPLRWRVENSWSDKRGHKGYCLMTDEWFNEYNYQICLDKNRLPKEVTEILKQQPIVLPPWDPMGSLAE